MTLRAPLVLFAMFAAACQSRPAAALSVREVRARLFPNGRAAVYLTVFGGGAGDRLLDARSAVAERVELHEILEDHEIARMRPAQDGFIVPKGGELVLAPGGKHLMVFGLDAGARDAEVPLELIFSGAGVVRVRAELRE